MPSELEQRLRDLLSDETQKIAWELADHECGGWARGVCWHCDARADSLQRDLISVLLPLLSSLQEEREREIREALAGVRCDHCGYLLTHALSERGPTGQCEKCKVAVSRLTSSSSTAAQEQK